METAIYLFLVVAYSAIGSTIAIKAERIKNDFVRGIVFLSLIIITIVYAYYLAFFEEEIILWLMG